MGTAFFDDRHKVQKLHSTICLYKGIPYYVDCSDRQIGENMVKLYTLGNVRADGLAHTVDYRNAEFDYRAPPLGYTNWLGRAHYMVRNPDRQNNQGLAQHCIHNAEEIALADPYRWFTSEEARNCILGVHPTLSEATAKLFEYGTGVRSSSFSRHMAVSKLGAKGVSLNYRGRMVGSKGNINQDRFTLMEGRDQSFLLKFLSNAGVPVQ